MEQCSGSASPSSLAFSFFILHSVIRQLECTGSRRGGRQAQKHSPPPVASERTPNQGAGALASTSLARALHKRRERDRDGWRRRWLPEGGETNCRNLCRSGSRLLIYSLPLFFFLPPTTSSFPPFFCFLFGSRRISGKGKKAFFRPFSFLRLPPSSPPPPFPPPAFLFLFWEVFPGGRPDGF